jgi:hypothetical protein
MAFSSQPSTFMFCTRSGTDGRIAFYQSDFLPPWLRDKVVTCERGDLLMWGWDMVFVTVTGHTFFDI